MRRLLRNDLLRGAAIGVAVALIVVAAITRIAESDTSIWWWPATAVAGVFGGAVIGALIGSRIADRLGPKPVVATCFLIGAVSIFLLTASLPLGILLLFVAIVGLGTSGTQTLIYGFVANYYRTNVRGAGVAWCAGFGRLGGVGGPIIGGLLIAAGMSTNSIFYVLAALAAVGMVLTLLVPVRRGPRELHSTPIEPSQPSTTATTARPTSS